MQHADDRQADQVSGAEVSTELARRLRVRQEWSDHMRLVSKYQAARWGITRAIVNSLATGHWLRQHHDRLDAEGFARLLRRAGIAPETAQRMMRVAGRHPTMTAQCTGRGLARGRMSPMKTLLLGEGFRSLTDSLLLELLALIAGPTQGEAVSESLLKTNLGGTENVAG